MSGRAAGRRRTRLGGGGECPVCEDVAVAGWDCPYCDVGDEDSPAPGPMPEADRLALVGGHRRERPPALLDILAAPGGDWPTVRTVPTAPPGGGT